MNCNEAGSLVAAYADRELDGLRKYSFERHLRGCAQCAAKRDEILALRAHLRAEVPYFAVPPGLRERVKTLVANAPPPRAQPSRERWHWLTGGALAGCMATLVAFVIGNNVMDWRANENVAAEAVAAHVHATLDRQLIEVASSDRHTVKPWLSARLDYSPPVQDYAGDGFPLVGGRIATLDQRPVATLVYRYRNHVIDVFVLPGSSRAAPRLRTIRGFNAAQASGPGWDWVGVSDVSSDVLTAFVERLARDAPTP